MSRNDSGTPDDGSWLDDLTPEERAWLKDPDNEPRGYQPKSRPEDPQKPPPPPDGRASPSPRTNTSANDSKPDG
jgi:hypothetical protein